MWGVAAPSTGTAPPTRALTRWVVLAVLTLLVGVASGVAGALVDLFFHAVGHAAFGYSRGTFDEAVHHTPYWRRILAPTIGGALAGLLWWQLRSRGTVPTLNSLVRERTTLRRLGGTVADAVVQLLFVGAGGSVGREGAPRQVAAGSAGALVDRFGVTDDDRRVLVASAAGAGLAAVYTTPVAGALFALEIVLRRWSAKAVVVGLVSSFVATFAAMPVVHREITYDWPGGPLEWDAAAWLLVCIPLVRLLGRLFSRVVRTAHRPVDASLVWKLTLAGAAVGTTSCWLPAVPGNGKAIVQEVLAGHAGLLVLLGFLVMKPLLTGLCLRAGATGGVLTPALATGAALGAAVAVVVTHLGGTPNVPVWALMGAAGLLAVTQRAPLFAALFAWELTQPGVALLPVLLVVVIGATVRAPREEEHTHLPPGT